MKRLPIHPDLPWPNTYWVIPGRLLAGEHPGGQTKSETQKRLARLHVASINYFLDLTEPGEIAAYRHLLPAGTKYLRSAISDMNVPELVVQMQVIQSRIRAGLSFGRSIYVHCRAGIGRTGIVIGCYLVEQGLDGKSALKQLNVLWQQSERAKTWPRVPQTVEQAAYIERWPEHRKFHNRARLD